MHNFLKSKGDRTLGNTGYEVVDWEIKDSEEKERRKKIQRGWYQRSKRKEKVDSSINFCRDGTRLYHYCYSLSTEAKGLAEAKAIVSDKIGLPILII